MNPFVSRLSNERWLIPVSVMCLILGFMISLAWVTNETRSSRKFFLNPDQGRRINEASVDLEAFQQLSSEVTKLQKGKTELENALASRDGQSKVLNDNLQEAKVFAGVTEVDGPGVVITLKDFTRTSGLGGTVAVTPDSIIHDTDVLRVVNELYASGAEAISVNHHRIAGSSSFRCVGPTILVNDVKIASPVIIRAIGDSATLQGAMNLPGGVLAEIRQADASMVQVEVVKKMTLPAYVGTTAKKFAMPTKVSK